jgi:hypothetical protein
MSNFGDAIRLQGAAFCLDIGNFAKAEEMLSKLGSEASASTATIALRQRMRDAQIRFWETRYTFASAMSSRFPAYLSGRLYLDFCCQLVQRDSARAIAHATERTEAF